jgi:hypothetical protein
MNSIELVIYSGLTDTIFFILPQFYLEDTDDDLVMSALRLLVKDLLVLFQAVNEGVINVLGEQ